MPEPGEKASRRAAAEQLGDYHEALIRRYKRSARELWEFCPLSRPEDAALAIEDARERDEEVDWWAAGEPRRRR
jgi:hypothetical protein